MKKWFKYLDISKGLQICFLVSALLSVFVGIVGLYTLGQQRKDINFALDEGFPKVQAAFQAEEQLNLLNNAFLNLYSIKSVDERVEWRTRIDIRLNALKDTMRELEDSLDTRYVEFFNHFSELLDQITNNINDRLASTEQFNQIHARVNWLHEDFHNEFTALLQEISWQQSALVSTYQQSSNDKSHFEALKKSQQELQLIYGFITYEDQIVSELKQQITGVKGRTDPLQKNYLIYLKLLVENKIKQLEIHSSTYTIQQIIDELFIIGLDESQLPAHITRRQHIDMSLNMLTEQAEDLLTELRYEVRDQVGNSQKQLQMLQNIVEKSSHISGLVIFSAMLIAFLFLIVVNFFYIRFRLLKRFQLLNHAVDRLHNGESNVKIPIYGIDELGRIARLLRSFLFEMNKKNAELEKRNQTLISEIQDRIQVQNELVTTQNELIQTAKLAIVGQTLTSISHEINQPLNALSAYVFSAKKALANHDEVAVNRYFDKISQVIDRTALIIKRLRQFSRKGVGKLQPVDLMESIQSAWSLLESKHKQVQGQLILPPILPVVFGEDVLLQQVFVNLFLNSIEATSKSPTIITIEIMYESEEEIVLAISDNGKGWPLNEPLLQPFSTSKSINLGLGLSISNSIIKQCDGEFYIASTLDNHALIILQLRKANYVQS
ncbi:ATP-binding protein [Zophobihabitans entericus]|uniref:histidine kinase n=1 Tax=Zophobihabitans entericus TaxID=1635327 RepID=A0A6G9I9A7_9GAMM|nr:ATP-binding protein [Zophobihabitans entericus]QIQ20801.1 histidine kinase [Zophobihabitans entericus]